jgi:sialidase-1
LRPTESTQPARTIQPTRVIQPNQPNRASRASRRRLVSVLLAASAVSGLLLGSALTATAATAAIPATPTIRAASVHTATACAATPFRSVPARKIWFRAPAVVRTTSGTLVAFAEKRDNHTSDFGDFDIVTSRSTDSGCTWSPDQVIGNDAGNKVGSPTPVVDSTTGDVLVFSVVTPIPGGGGSGKGLYLQTSSDDGQTFSALLSRPIRAVNSRLSGVPGPGHAIELRLTHPGRLLLPVAYRSSSGHYGVYGLYSDDHGRTWRVGYSEQDSTGAADYIEGTIAELPSGKLFISYRLRHDDFVAAGTARRYAYSTDGGAGLTAPFRDLPALKIISVEGSALALTGSHSGELLFSAPSDPSPLRRMNMAVFISTTDGASWPRKYQVQLESRPGSYSDLVQLDDSNLGILYETGISSYQEGISWQTIAVTDLTDPALAATSLKYQRTTKTYRTSEAAKVFAVVKVNGAASPPGRVTLTATGGGASRSVSVDLTYSNRGQRWLTLPKLGPGAYRLSLKYSGSARIKAATTSAGTLHVARR